VVGSGFRVRVTWVVGGGGERPLPASGGLLISMVCMAMMSSPTKHSTYWRTWRTEK